MDKVFSMFRVFDIAFFLPGIFMWYLLTEHIGGIFACSPSNAELAKVDGIFLLAQRIGLIFLLGLIIHGLQRFVLQNYKPQKKEKKNPEKPWYFKLEREKQEDLALYFWYLRATAYNLGVACWIGLLGFMVQLFLKDDYQKWIWSSLGAAVAAVLFFFIGNEFHRSLHQICPPDDKTARGGSTKQSQAEGENPST